MQFKPAIRSDRSESHQYKGDKVCMHTETRDKDEQRRNEKMREGESTSFGRAGHVDTSESRNWQQLLRVTPTKLEAHLSYQAYTLLR
jgi:hypothetical protein